MRGDFTQVDNEKGHSSLPKDGDTEISHCGPSPDTPQPHKVTWPKSLSSSPTLFAQLLLDTHVCPINSFWVTEAQVFLSMRCLYGGHPTLFSVTQRQRFFRFLFWGSILGGQHTQPSFPLLSTHGWARWHSQELCLASSFLERSCNPCVLI